ncbi:MAG: hypothetical protein SGJ01_04640 [Gemmatimonadota bacterium]|mgnify:CR=1 FL=1|nr:hypothetical protein [Gemmatimonadota bacterium]
MRRLARLALLALPLLLPANGCAPTPAAAEVRGEDVFVTAVGDTLTVHQFAKVTGSADSVAYLFSAARAASVRITRMAPANGAPLVWGPAKLVPIPAMLDGDTTTVSACPTAWRKGQATTFACSTKLYTRPVIPPNVTPDSLTVFGMIPITDAPLAGLLFAVNANPSLCVAFKFKDGKVGIRSVDLVDTMQFVGVRLSSWNAGTPHRGCAYNYGTQIAQALRVHAVTFSRLGTLGGDSAARVSPASPLRQLAMDTICATLTTSGGSTITPSSWDASPFCQAKLGLQATSPRPLEVAYRP